MSMDISLENTQCNKINVRWIQQSLHDCLWQRLRCTSHKARGNETTCSGKHRRPGSSIKVLPGLNLQRLTKWLGTWSNTHGLTHLAGGNQCKKCFALAIRLVSDSDIKKRSYLLRSVRHQIRSPLGCDRQSRQTRTPHPPYDSNLRRLCAKLFP